MRRRNVTHLTQAVGARVTHVSNGVTACVIGVLGIVVLLSFPTLALILGVVAVILGLIGRRRATLVAADVQSTQRSRWNSVGIAIGAVAILSTLVVVFVSSV